MIAADCQEVTEYFLKNLHLTKVDEIWSYVKKGENVR